MNRNYRYVWSGRDGPLLTVSPEPKGTGESLSRDANVERRRLSYVVHAMMIAMISTVGPTAHAQLQGGVVSAGGATISSSSGNTTINQSTSRAAINWQRFDINPSESVRFIQPDRNSVALNRVHGSNPSSILGSLSANGQVFLLNPNGVLFGREAQVNVGGLVASTLGISDSDFMAGRYRFSGAGSGAVLNQGSINADGGYVAMLGANVSNEGVISARLGTVALAAGNAVTLDVAGDGLLNVTLEQGVANALVENSGQIAADGGFVLMTTQAAGRAFQGVVNNTGVVRAQTIRNRDGKIMLMGDMDSGTVNVAGTLDASAPIGGDGGFIETSAASVKIADSGVVTARSERGKPGTWLIDPRDYTIALAGGDTTGTALSATLSGGTSVTILNTQGGADGAGDIHVNDTVDWTATAGAETTLTLLAKNDVNVNAPISATRGNLVVCCGRDVNVNAAIVTVNGSVFLGAGRNININAAMTTTDGNIAMCAGNDVNISAAMTLTNGSASANQSLGLPLGLTIVAGLDGSGPGSGSGTVTISSPPNSITTTGGVPMATIYYNPTSYQTGTSVFESYFTGSGGDPREVMWVYPEAEDKVFDGTTTATLIGLRGDLEGIGVALTGLGTANFTSPSVGSNKRIIFSGFGLGGDDAGNFALMNAGDGFSFPENCCNFRGRTTGTILSGSTSPGEPTDETPIEVPGGSGTPSPTSPTPEPGAIPIPTVPRPLPTFQPTGVAQIVASILPTVSFVPPAVASDTMDTVASILPTVSFVPPSTAIRMPSPVELVQVMAMQEPMLPAVQQTYPVEAAPEPMAVPELPRKPDRN